MTVPTMNPETVEALRYLYAALSIIAGTGFVATLIVRWDVLHRGERALRVGVAIEHVVITYGAYVAIVLAYPPTYVALLMTVSLAVICLGFVIWAADLLLHGDPGPRRLTDPPTTTTRRPR